VLQTLPKLMSQIVRKECRAKDNGPDAPTFEIVSTLSEKQKQAYDLLKKMEFSYQKAKES